MHTVDCVSCHCPRLLADFRCAVDLQGWAAHRVLPPLGLFPNLREVRVQQNGIRELPVAQITPLVQLQTLDISMNDVSLLPPRPGTAALAAAPVDHRECNPIPRSAARVIATVTQGARCLGWDSRDAVTGEAWRSVVRRGLGRV